MITNTKSLFAALAKQFQADCICDIGSCDGSQAVLFRDLCPTARVLAFEANPLNFEAMRKQARLAERRIELHHCAISDAAGTAEFFITDVNYADPAANKGTSSLLLRGDLPVREAVKVETCRIDEFLAEACPEAKRIALWIDVEGAENRVLEGMERIREKVRVIHVETALVPMRPGQVPLDHLSAAMAERGFVLCGSNIREAVGWGDVVFVQQAAARALGLRLAWCKFKAHLAYWLQVDRGAVYLKERFPAAYRLFRRIYLRIGT